MICTCPACTPTKSTASIFFVLVLLVLLLIFISPDPLFYPVPSGGSGMPPL